MDLKNLYSCQSVSRKRSQNYSIRLKFGTNVYMLCELSYIVLVYIAQLERVQDHIKVSQYIMAYEATFYRISFDITIMRQI